jgi:MFS family permease
VKLKILVLLYAGYGVLGGIGLGLGYISPVSTLIKWYPDRPGMATGLAIMGFGGGAMVGAPLAVTLMDKVGLSGTFVAMGTAYLALMLFGAAIVRLPATVQTAAAGGGLTASEAIRTPSFWLVWGVLFTNVTAGIGILGQASPMIQEMFKQTPAAAAGFVGLLSLFNLAGRFAWSSLSDRLGRKRTYAIYLGLGMLLYGSIPSLGQTWLFVLVTCIILSMYGGGFATVPAYLRDLFGTKEVGAIHGRLLTAWSTAALVGPSIVTYAREYQLAHGVAKADAYGVTMYFLAGLLAVGFVCNARIPAIRREATARGAAKVEHAPLPPLRLAGFWIVVLIPLSWGVYQVAKKSIALFSSAGTDDRDSAANLRPPDSARPACTPRTAGRRRTLAWAPRNRTSRCRRPRLGTRALRGRNAARRPGNPSRRCIRRIGHARTAPRPPGSPCSPRTANTAS